MFHNRRIWTIVSMFVVVAMLMTACAPAAAPVPPTAVPPTAVPPTAVPPTAVPPAATTAPAVQLMKKAAPDCSYGGLMKSIEAVDELTVKFTLCSPDGSFPSKIAFTSMNIQSAKHLQDSGGKPLESALGTGPYMVKEWVRGDHLTLVTNPNYWGEAPKTKTVIFKWNKEATARLTSLKSGEVDGIDNPDTNDFKAIQADSTLKLYPRTALNIFYIGLNNTKPPLDNDKVRQALAIGITIWKVPRNCWLMLDSPTASRSSCRTVMLFAAICLPQARLLKKFRRS